jgi:hypothetical protein
MISIRLVCVSFGRRQEGRAQNMLKRLFCDSNLLVSLLLAGTMQQASSPDCNPDDSARPSTPSHCKPEGRYPELRIRLSATNPSVNIGFSL